jgi:hypothetical protein
MRRGPVSKGPGPPSCVSGRVGGARLKDAGHPNPSVAGYNLSGASGNRLKVQFRTGGARTRRRSARHTAGAERSVFVYASARYWAGGIRPRARDHNTRVADLQSSGEPRFSTGVTGSNDPRCPQKSAPVNHDLQRVVVAWALLPDSHSVLANMPAPIRRAVLALIVEALPGPTPR